MNDHVFSQATIQQYTFDFNVRTCISIFFGLLSIAAILRYTRHSSMNEYKFHLLNMAVWILLCDLSLTIICRPYPTFPLAGGCMLGEFNGVLIRRLGANGTMYAVTMLELFVVSSSMATICNATIHRYVFVSDLLDRNSKRTSKAYIYTLMFLIQVVWPLISVLVCLKIDLRPQQAIDTYNFLYPDIMERIKNQPCIVFWVDNRALYSVYSPIILAILHGSFCGGGSMIILIMSWRKIFDGKLGKLSQRTIKMQRKLIITLFFQTALPNLSYVIIMSTFTFGVMSGIESAKSFVNNAFLYICLHSALNCLIMFATIPTYYKGLIDDVKFIIHCGTRYRETRLSSISNINTTTNLGPNSNRIFKRRNTECLNVARVIE